MSDKADYTYGEPPPVKTDGPGMHDLVMAEIAKRDPLASKHLRNELEARRDMGFEKYQTLLQANNGRNALQDALEEMLDALVYMKQHLVEQDQLGHRARGIRKIYDRQIEDCYTVILMLKVREGDHDSADAIAAETHS